MKTETEICQLNIPCEKCPKDDECLKIKILDKPQGDRSRYASSGGNE